MKHDSIINTLNKWVSLLESFSTVTINFMDDQQIVDTRLKERQQIIDSLQVLDAELTEIRALRKAGWPEVAAEMVEKIEVIIEKGNVISSTCVAKDKESLDIVTNLRKEVSGKISNVRKTKGYLISSHVVKKSPSIIVDSHA